MKKTSNLTVAEVLSLFMQGKTFSPNTVSSYVQATKNIGRLLNVPIRKLTPVMIAEWIGEARDALGSRACECAATRLKAACKYAVELELLASSPFKSKIPPADKKEIQPFTDEEVVRIVGAAMKKKKGAIVILAIACGMRQGEILGLRWGDINWSSSTVRINRQVTECNGVNVVKIPKTKRSVRTLTLPAAALVSLRMRLDESRKVGRDGPDDWVFSASNGKPLYRTNVGQGLWRPLLKRLGIPNRGLHHARHTAATALLSRNIPVEAVSAMLGHGKASMTYDTYSHWRDGSGAVVAAAMDILLGCPGVAPQPPLKLHDAS